MRTKCQGTANAFDSPNKPLLQLLLNRGCLSESVQLVAFCHDLGALGARKEIDQVDDAILVDVAGLQDAGRWQVLLFGGASNVLRRRNAKVAANVLVQETAEDGRGVKVRPEPDSATRLSRDTYRRLPTSTCSRGFRPCRPRRRCACFRSCHSLQLGGSPPSGLSGCLRHALMDTEKPWRFGAGVES